MTKTVAASQTAAEVLPLNMEGTYGGDSLYGR